MFSLIFSYFYLLCLWKDQIKITTRKLLPSRYGVLNTCFLSFFRLNEEARCNLQFRMHQNVAFSQILWPRTDKYDMKVWFGIFFWTLTPSHFFMSLANLSSGELVLLWSWKQIVVKQCWKSSLMFKKHAMTVKSAQLSDYKCRIAEKAKHSLTYGRRISLTSLRETRGFVFWNSKHKHDEAMRGKLT